MIDRNDTSEFVFEQPGAWRIKTRSGSEYFVALDQAGAWWLSGRNRPNPFSLPMPAGSWRIERPVPWPVQIGLPVALLAPSMWAKTNPARIPGGGKVTSPVVSVEGIPLEADEGDDSPFLSWE